MTQLTENVFAVEVPEGASGFYYDGRQSIGFKLNGELRFVHLPFIANWQILCTTKEASEEQAHQIVESVTTANEMPVYRDYEFSLWMKTAVGSLRSLLTSKGLHVNKNYVLVKKR